MHKWGSIQGPGAEVRQDRTPPIPGAVRLAALCSTQFAHPFPLSPHFPRWVIYNDQKVCASEKPPKDLGYIYFYQRVAS